MKAGQLFHFITAGDIYLKWTHTHTRTQINQKPADLVTRGLNGSLTGTTRAEDRHLALPRERDPTEVFILQGKHQKDVNIQVLQHVQQSCNGFIQPVGL